MTAPYVLPSTTDGGVKVNPASDPTTTTGPAYDVLWSFQAIGWKSDYSSTLTYAFTAIVGNVRYPLIGRSVASQPNAYIPAVSAPGTGILNLVVYDQYEQTASVNTTFTTTDPYANAAVAAIATAAQTAANNQLRAASESGNPAATVAAVANVAILLARGGSNDPTPSAEVVALKAQLINALVSAVNPATLNAGAADTFASAVLSVRLDNAGP